MRCTALAEAPFDHLPVRGSTGFTAGSAMSSIAIRVQYAVSGDSGGAPVLSK